MRLRLAGALLLAGAGLQAQPSPLKGKVPLTPEPAPPSGRERWRVQFFHDRNDSEYVIRDLKFASPLRGVAVGVLQERGKSKPAALVTGDGGKKWEFISLPEEPVSLFALDERNVWLVTERGVWKTVEAGRSWNKLASLRGLTGVVFVSESLGFAVGFPKAVYETRDGGKKWTKVTAAEKAQGTPQYTTFLAAAFASPKVGMIAGVSRPPRRAPPQIPEWVDPEEARRRQLPNLVILLQTVDGGVTWRADASSIFGAVTRLSLVTQGRSLALIQFNPGFWLPAEVHAIDLRTGGSEAVFRRDNRNVTDVLVLPGGPGWLAAVEPPGRLPDAPVPGKVKILVSEDLKWWRETEVDYRANARRAVLAAAGGDHLWAATDTGMILKMER
jgi:photosystem II stability/assembly factor-like uncharacterized protein